MLRTQGQFLAILLLSLCTDLLGQAGMLDSTFNFSGIVQTSIGDLNSYGEDVIIQPDGRIVVLGTASQQGVLMQDLLLIRYLPDGSLDPSFGSAGIVMTPSSDFYGVPKKGDILPDGRIIAAGTGRVGSDNRFRVLRFLPDGSPDMDFGVGGVAEANIVIGGQTGESMLAVCIQNDGRVILGGRTASGNGADMALVRFTSEGSLDSTFGGDGIVVQPLSPLNDQINALVMLPDSDILAVGATTFGTQQNDTSVFALARFTQSGELNSSFGQGGVAAFQISQGHAMATSATIDAAGRILAAGFSGYPALMTTVRCLPGGTLDASFNGDGIAAIGVATESSVARSLHVQSDGKVLVATEAWDGAGTLFRFALLRFQEDGSLDNDFGTNGVVQTGIIGMAAVPSGMDLQADGRIVVGGFSFIPGGQPEVTVARYFNDLNIGMAGFAQGGGSTLVYPNPLVDQTTLIFDLFNEESLTLNILDAAGRIIRTVFTNAMRAPGEHRETLDLVGLAAGNYTLVLHNGEGAVSVKVVKQ